MVLCSANSDLRNASLEANARYFGGRRAHHGLAGKRHFVIDKALSFGGAETRLWSIR